MSNLVPNTPFISLRNIVLITISDSSKRVYMDTYNKWLKWAVSSDVDPMAINALTVDRFLKLQHVTITTRRLMLASLRKMMQIAFVFEPSNELLRQNYESLKLLKVSSAGIGGKERSKRALNHDEINAVLGVWKDSSLQARRNYTLLALLFASGLRRSEVVVLRWDDLDLERGVLYVRHGKGDKSEEIAIFGEFALNALREWRIIIGSERQFVFCPLSMKDNGNEIDEDRAMDAANVYRIIKQTSQRCGVKFSPHDTRRSLATELLHLGLSIAEVQQQLRHSKPSTTLLYAKAGAAQVRRQTVKKLGYGDE